MRSSRPFLLRCAAPLCVCFLLCVGTFAQQSPYKPGSPLLMWKVTSGTHTAYVVGSVHLGSKQMYPLPAGMEDAFRASSVLLVEVDIRHVDPAAMQQLMIAGSYPPGDDLFRHIAPETRARLNAYLGSSSLFPPELLARFRPWALGTLIQTMAMVKAGLNPSEGIDMHFLDQAGDKKVEQLEDASWQVKLLSQMPESMGDEWITQAIAEAQASQDHWAKLANCWSHGAADEMDAMITADSAHESSEARAFERRLREERNPRMTDRLEKCLHSDEACFMVVGAAHVIGKEGIVQQLRARGYRVEQTRVGEGKQSATN